MMKKLSRDDLMGLEEYSETRVAFRSEVMDHKRNRRIDLGTNAALYFEDNLTIRYQVQEMLRIERIFDAAKPIWCCWPWDLFIRPMKA